MLQVTPSRWEKPLVRLPSTWNGCRCDVGRWYARAEAFAVLMKLGVFFVQERDLTACPRKNFASRFLKHVFLKLFPLVHPLFENPTGNMFIQGFGSVSNDSLTPWWESQWRQVHSKKIRTWITKTWCMMIYRFTYITNVKYIYHSFLILDSFMN